MLHTAVLTRPPLSLSVLQDVRECSVGLVLYVSVTQLIQAKLSVFARKSIVHLWWRLFAALIRPPTPMSASWRKPSATHSDASRCCARDPAVSTITCLKTNKSLLGILTENIHVYISPDLIFNLIWMEWKWFGIIPCAFYVKQLIFRNPLNLRSDLHHLFYWF